MEKGTWWATVYGLCKELDTIEWLILFFFHFSCEILHPQAGEYISFKWAFGSPMKNNYDLAVILKNVALYMSYFYHCAIKLE